MEERAFRFEELTVYQKSLMFSQEIYQMTQLWPKEHLFGLTDQLRRASLSIPLNIAEGTSRSTKDFQRFLLVARGSCYECVPLISMARSLKLLSVIQRQTMYGDILELSRMISKLRTSLANH